ncbi:unnamed protein product [Rotaria sordida]|uniref:F-box domain-containing protein n=1 Tax=Rotaria sordida TaxID=392033 RepID=A0A814RVV3_9BILA|nr:unnamed protein product [Rotaria sordida]
MSITQLEHLSNEIFYEIFDYLDGCFVYSIFSNLNIRFKYLFNDSSLPLKLNLSWTSKSTFEYYYNYIIIPNLNRIISLHIPNPLAIKSILSLFSINNSFIRLESINFGRVNAAHITSLLTHLKKLPRLFSLSININNPKYDTHIIFQLIFLLPVLKYCKISSENDESMFSIPILARKNEQQESSIEYLIINSICEFDQLIAILSYTPRLTHLSCHSLYIGNDQIQIPIIVTTTTNLRKLSIELDATPFHIFKTFVSKISFQLEVLRISAKYENSYLDAKQWQQLISCHMPHLRIFDFQFKSQLCDDEMKSIEYDKLIEQFNNKFWYERKWFFTYQNCRGDYGPFKIFYSIRPYRRNYYKLYERTTNNLDISTYQDNSMHLCRHILIINQWTNVNCSIQFPYATKLTLNGGFVDNIPLLIRSLSSIISLTQITDLVLEYNYLFMNKFLMLLQYLPNIKSLTIPQTSIIQTHDLSENEIETILIISKRNHIKKISIIDRECCTLKQLHFLFDLCPQIEYLTINLAEIYEDIIIEFLISKMKENNYRFFLLCLARWNANIDMIKKIHLIINREKLLDNYSLELFKDNIYLWC